MTTIIRRYRRRPAAPLMAMLAAILVALALITWVLLVIWAKGGPQPVHTIVVAIPAPQLPPTSGQTA